MLGGDFDTPIMYQDLANYTMGPMTMPGLGFGTGIGAGTSYLGGTQIKPQLDHDSVEIMNRKREEGKSTFKKVALTAGALLLLGFIPYFRRRIKKAGGIINYIKNLWNPQPKLTRWQKFKNWLNRSKTSHP